MTGNMRSWGTEPLFHFTAAIFEVLMAAVLAGVYLLQKPLTGVDTKSRMLWIFVAGLFAGAVIDQTMMGLSAIPRAKGGHATDYVILGVWVFSMLFFGFCWVRSKSRKKRWILATLFLVELGLMVIFLSMW